MAGRAALVVVFLLVGVLLVGCGGNEQVQQEEPEERTQVIERTVVKTVEAPERTVVEEQAAAPEEQPPEAEQPPEEILALQYQYINEGNYEAAYSLFAEQSKQLVSPEQYRAFFENAGYYDITDYTFLSVQAEGDVATIVTDYTVSSGIAGIEQYQRTQQLVGEGGNWRVVMRAEQVGIFSGTGPAETPDVQQPEDANTTQVTVEVSSDVPVDVSIMDDNLDVGIQEEITGSEIYEFVIAADSGLIVSAMNESLSGNISIAVYENGELIAEDNSSEGYAQVMY